MLRNLDLKILYNLKIRRKEFIALTQNILSPQYPQNLSITVVVGRVKAQFVLQT